MEARRRSRRNNVGGDRRLNLTVGCELKEREVCVCILYGPIRKMKTPCQLAVSFKYDKRTVKQ